MKKTQKCMEKSCKMPQKIPEKSRENFRNILKKSWKDPEKFLQNSAKKFRKIPLKFFKKKIRKKPEKSCKNLQKNPGKILWNF